MKRANLIALTIPRGVESHAVERAIERLGVAPSGADWEAALASIRNRTALLVRKSGRNPGITHHEVWLVKLAGQDAFVAYVPEQGKIITVLPNGTRPARLYSAPGGRDRRLKRDRVRRDGQ